jgi:hypothetical protein
VARQILNRFRISAAGRQAANSSQGVDESDFMEAFAGQAEVIEDAASPDDIEHVRGRINCMLGSRGLIPSDNEGEPCD